jgi:hypothetical protein
MPGQAQNVDRFLAAREGGAVVPDDVMNWLENGLRTFRYDPAIGLEKALGLCGANRNSRILERQGILQKHVSEFEAGKSSNAASQDIADNLQLLAQDYDDPNIAPQYRLLFDKLSALGLRMPKYDTIYAEVRKI